MVNESVNGVAVVSDENLLSGGQAETSDACWCCAPAGKSCTPANKAGLGRAFLTRCYE